MATAIVSAIAGVGGECQSWNSMQEQRIERVFSHVAADNLGVGDVASITIFEVGWGGSSSRATRPGNFVTLLDRVVDTNGNITVRYGGTIRALGRAPAEVQEADH